MRIAFFCSQDFNIGVAYVIAYYQSQGHEVKLFFDPCQFNRGYAGNKWLSKLLSIENELVAKAKEFNPDIACFSCVTATYSWALAMAWKIKEKIKCPIRFGGVHPTLCPEEVRESEIIDEVVEGALPISLNSLIPNRRIFLKQLPSIHTHIQIFITGTGCPMRCSFCNNHSLYPSITKKSVESVIEELAIEKEGGLRYALFVDDIFTIPRAWFTDFVDSYIRTVYLPFTCFGHPQLFNEKVAGLLELANCRCVWIGVQTGKERLRTQVLNRHETNEQITETVKLIKKHKMRVMIDHIFGIPTETEKDIRDSYEFYKSLKPDVVNCYELLYFPRAEINKWGTNKAKYQRDGGIHYKKYAKAFETIPLICH